MKLSRTGNSTRPPLPTGLHGQLSNSNSEYVNVNCLQIRVCQQYQAILRNVVVTVSKISDTGRKTIVILI